MIQCKHMRIQNLCILLLVTLYLTTIDCFQFYKTPAVLRHHHHPCLRKATCYEIKPLRASNTHVEVAAVKIVKEKATAVFAGNVLPFLSKLFSIFIPGKKREALVKALTNAVDIREIMILAFFGWGFPRLYKKFYDWRVRRFSGSGDSDENEEHENSIENVNKVKFTDSWLGSSSVHVGNAAKIAFAVYTADLLAISLNSVGFKYFQQSGFSRVSAKVGYSLWASQRIRYFKSLYFARSLKKSSTSRARALILDRALDVVIYVTTAGVIIDLLKLDFGMALSSLFAFGGVGTVVFSLASRDVAHALISGLALGASQRFAVGDEIVLGDGTAGFVTNLGWFDSEIRSYDETKTTIPNAQLSSLRVTNKSKIKWSQVKQTLAISYKDIDQLPVIIETIKDEIKDTMGRRLITKGRPFRTHFRNFCSDHLEVVVDVHLFVPPTGDVYWDTRQEVLFAIAKAVKKLGVEFALPTFSTHVSSAAPELKGVKF